MRMTEDKKYKCVNCGEAAAALYKTYGPSVLKLTKCDKCNEIVDKYIEYDPVIVMIDLVLMSQEAQRHIIYNTEFKSYWKLFIILMMLETYGVWRNDSLFNIGINSIVCDQHRNSTINSTHLNIPISIPVPESWRSRCWGWVQEMKGDDSDLFIWEKDFYIHFLSTFSGIVMFILTVHVLMKIMKPFSLQNEVCLRRVLKALSLANTSSLLAAPMLVWGAADPAPHTRALHYLLVFAYSFVVSFNVFTVLYECPVAVTMFVLMASNCAKYLTTFHATPYIRELLL